MASADDPRLIALSSHDNVCVACTALVIGETLVVDGVPLVVDAGVALGHKIARRDIANGTAILKYGARIGIATEDIRRGQHVHVHNMKSNYLPTYTLDAGHRYIGRTE
jgi:altronate dehydratase small subunit